MTHADHHNDQEASLSMRSPVSRRRFIQAAVGATVGAAGLLSAGEGAGASAVTALAAMEQVRRGGRLRMAHSGAGVAETLDPHRPFTGIDNARAINLFDRLTRLLPNGTVSLELAESFEPNADATAWTVRLRSGVMWHDGKPLTADDVIYTLRRIGAPKSTLVGKSTVDVIDLPRLKKMDRLTVRLPLKHPIADLPTSFSTYFMGIIQNGTTSFKHPIGTGPFMFVSFTAGQSSLFRRNPNYWMHGKPYVDELEQISIADTTARVNALLGGQVDGVETMSFAQAKAQQSAGQIAILSAPNGNVNPITMSCDLEPFTDVRVRQAMRLIADRPGLIRAAQLGIGTIGNDLYGKGLPDYDYALPQRHQDIEKAKFLLKAAGKSDLKVTLYSAKITGGFLESATAFAEQAKAAGVTINVNVGPADTYFSDKYLKFNFGQTGWSLNPLDSFMQQALVSDAPYNETHWRRPEWDKLFRQAQGELNAAKRKTLMYELQQQLWNEGGYLIWGFSPVLDGLAKNVRGAVPDPTGDFSAYVFRDYWLA